MRPEILEWFLLLGRWLHITVGITWIGTSIFFMWLDRTFQVNEKSSAPGHVGELWMVHGGGFYRVEKLQMGSTRVPEHLHWFKWESYWTWMSGVFLLAMIFYTGGGTFLLDSTVSHLSFAQAAGIGISSILVSWVFYDFLWERKITKTEPWVGHFLTLLWLAGMSWFLCSTLSGRAAYIHVGAMLGTWMTANVFMRIIPRQVLMVEAAKKGEPVNQDWSKNAKNRSTHNTYFTLPVIFIMLSNHFPSTYGSRWNWLILLLLCAAGAAIREFFVVRLKNPDRSKVFGAIGVSLILGLIFCTTSTQTLALSPDKAASTIRATAIELGTGEVKGIVKFDGTPPDPKKLLLTADCAKQGEAYLNDILVKNGKIQNVLIRITQGLEGKIFSDIPSETVLLDQRGCQYEPRVIGVRVGQKVDVLNSDPTFHNVKSVSQNNENFNIATPRKDDRITKIFDKPEVFLQTKCSVHPWMGAYIAVMDHPFFSVTNDSGEFQIKNIPPGRYTLEAWHEVFGTQKKELSIQPNQQIELEFSFKN